jgi:hypothetical protein
MKLTLTRLLETSRIMATKVGQEIPFFFDYMAEFVEQTIRALRNGLNFADNFACEIREVELTHDTAQTIQASKTVRMILFTRVLSTSQLLVGQGWYYDDNNNLTVKVRFSGGAGTAAPVVIVLLF